jgi:hypothetical protein
VVISPRISSSPQDCQLINTSLSRCATAEVLDEAGVRAGKALNSLALPSTVKMEQITHRKI